VDAKATVEEFALEFFELAARVEKEDIFAFETPASLKKSDVRLEGKERHVTELSVVSGLYVHAVVSASFDAVASIASKV
jgi:hypothetical protein